MESKPSQPHQPHHPHPRNEIISELLSKYKFSTGSRLNVYLETIKPGILPKVFKLVALLNMLKSIINNTRQFDQKNQVIILCNDDLTFALDVTALHVTQLKDYVYKQLELVSGFVPNIMLDIFSIPFIVRFSDAENSDYDNTYYEPNPPGITDNSLADTKKPVSDVILFTEPDLYYMFFQLKMVLSTTPSFPQNKSFFTFQEITQLTTDYIYAKRHSLIDFRNPFVCLVSKDPLGTVFQVKAFHSTQLSYLLLRNVICLK
jgi:hypothetical protein